MESACSRKLRPLDPSTMCNGIFLLPICHGCSILTCYFQEVVMVCFFTILILLKIIIGGSLAVCSQGRWFPCDRTRNFSNLLT